MEWPWAKGVPHRVDVLRLLETSLVRAVLVKERKGLSTRTGGEGVGGVWQEGWKPRA